MPAPLAGAEGPLPEAVAEAGQGSAPLRSRRLPLGHPPREPHLDGHLTGQRRPQQPCHVLRIEAARATAPYDDADVPGHHPHPGGHPARRGHRPQLARHHHQHQVELGQHLGHGLVHPARKVDHDDAAPTARSGHHRADGGRRHDHPVAAVPAEHPQLVQFGQGLLQRPGAHPAPGGREVRPAQPFGALAAEQYVHAAAQGVAVDEHGPLTGAGGPDGEGAGEGGGSRAAAAPDHPDGEGGPSGPFDDIGDPVHEPALGIGEQQHLLGSDLHRPLPHEGVVQVPSDEEDTSPARSAPHTTRGVVPDQHERSRLPATSRTIEAS